MTNLSISITLCNLLVGGDKKKKTNKALCVLMLPPAFGEVDPHFYPFDWRTKPCVAKEEEKPHDGDEDCLSFCEDTLSIFDT